MPDAATENGLKLKRSLPLPAVSLIQGKEYAADTRPSHKATARQAAATTEEWVRSGQTLVSWLPALIPNEGAPHGAVV